mgnify:CR=1 FL=1
MSERSELIDLDKGNPDILNDLSLLYMNIGERDYVSRALSPNHAVSLPRGEYGRLASNMSVAIEYLKPLLRFSRLRPDILNLIYYLAGNNNLHIDTFYSLVDLYRDIPEVGGEMLLFIAHIFRGLGLKVLSLSDARYLIDSCRESDLSFVIRVIGLIFKDTSNLKIAELLLSFADPKNKDIMKAIDFAMAKIFRYPSLLVDRYYRRIGNIKASVAEAIIRALGIAYMGNVDAYYSNSKVRYIFFNCLFRGSNRIRAQAIIALGYIFKGSGSRNIAFMISRFLGKDKLVDIAIARALRLIFMNNYNKIAKKILLTLLQRDDPDILREAVKTTGIVFDGLYDEEILQLLEELYRSELDLVFDEAFEKICKEKHRKIKIKIVVIGPESTVYSLIDELKKRINYPRNFGYHVFLGVRRAMFYIRSLGSLSVEFLFWFMPKINDLNEWCFRHSHVGLILFDKSDAETFKNLPKLVEYFWRKSSVKPIIIGAYPREKAEKVIPDEYGIRYSEMLYSASHAPTIYISDARKIPARENLKRILFLLIKYFLSKLKKNSDSKSSEPKFN